MTHPDDQDVDVRCEIATFSWSTPPKPSSCGFDWGAGIEMTITAHILCASDTIRDSNRLGTDGSHLLPYGSAIWLEPAICVSYMDGHVDAVSCANTRTGASFAMSQNDYRITNP